MPFVLKNIFKKNPNIEELTRTRNIRGLIRLFDSGDFNVQWHAASALGTMGPDATPYLLRFINHESINVRLGAIEALGCIRDPRAIDKLINILFSDNNSEIRWAAAVALGEIGEHVSIPYLVRALTDTDRYVRYGSAKSLELMGWHPNDDAETTYYQIAVQDWNSVKKIGKPAIDPLLHMLKEKHPLIRLKIIELIGDIGGIQGQKACMTALKDTDRNVRWKAVLSSKKCGVSNIHMPWGLSKSPRPGHNPYGLALLNFFFFGLGYHLMGRWWAFLVFTSYMTIIVLSQLEFGFFLPFLILWPMTGLFAIQTYFMAKQESEKAW